MNTFLRTLLSIAAVAAIGTTIGVAQQPRNGLTATIPFDFNVGRTTLPAGEYTISTDLTSGALQVQDAQHRAKVVVVTMTADKPSSPDQSQLAFRVYGGRHYLASMWNGTMGVGRSLMKTPAEREAEIAGVHPTTAVLIARK